MARTRPKRTRETLMCAGGANCICGTEFSDQASFYRPPVANTLTEARVREIIREEVRAVMLELVRGH